jgi:tetratricopeptide (TPR) repeat protein
MHLLMALLGALAVTNPPAATTNAPPETRLAAKAPDPNDPAEQAFRKLMAEDDAAHAEVDRWIKDNQNFAEKGGGIGGASLNGRIKQRLGQVREAYEAFLRQHPGHARARVAFASFLSDQGEEDAAFIHLEKARTLDPGNPAVWNQLANYYGHNSPVSMAFPYYEKAIELEPNEPVYYQNLGLTVYLFRRDATNYYHLGEPAVFEKAMALYRKALALDPDNFVLATDFAQSYYGYKPRPTGDPAADRQAREKHFADAMAAWQTAFKLARDDIERQGVLIHFARLQINAGRFAEARQNLHGATNAMFNATRQQLLKNLEHKSQAPAPAAQP